MANIQISDLCPVDADLEMVSLTDKELSVVIGGDMISFFSGNRDSVSRTPGSGMWWVRDGGLVF